MTKEELNKYNFGEKLEEEDKKVIITDKYWQSKEKAVEAIQANYGLKIGDFWILKTLSKSREYIIYNGLIISHNGCLKINDWLVKRGNGFKSQYMGDPEYFEFGEGKDKVYGYRQRYKEDVCPDGSSLDEVGEISNVNLKNAYPFAMLNKRTFDRVVLKKSKLAYDGIYSEEEADEFKQTL